MFSKVLLLIASGLLFSSIFFPLWRIELQAPQYPEGLVLQLYADKIGGDVDIINGLNHYIGMKTLHTENFFEFSIMKYIFIGFALAGLLILFLNKKKNGLYVFFGAFVLFVVLAASDFYRWNYNYGHDLNPDAAIKVPGMAYQPPLIGYKQLLNFGAFSIPDTGGYLLILAGMALFIAVVRESKYCKRYFYRNTSTVLVLMICVNLVSCNSMVPKPVKLNSDTCEFCKMTISDPKFVSEAVTLKGRWYKFDDISCMIKYAKTNSSIGYKEFYVADYVNEGKFIPAEKGFYLKGGVIRAPMRGNAAVFDSNEKMINNQKRLLAEKTDWSTLYNLY